MSNKIQHQDIVEDKSPAGLEDDDSTGANFNASKGDMILTERLKTG